MCLDQEDATKSDTGVLWWCAGTVRRTITAAGDIASMLEWEGDYAAPGGPPVCEDVTRQAEAHPPYCRGEQHGRAAMAP